MDRTAHLNSIIRTCITARDTLDDTVFCEAVDSIDELVSDLRHYTDALRAAARDSQRLISSLAQELS